MFHGDVSGWSDTSMLPSHLIEAMPTHPGTTRRAGNPWSGGSGSPFISYATSASSSALAMGRGLRT